MNYVVWNDEWRATTLAQLPKTVWDLIIIGGGITGAGIFRSAVSAGLRTLLVEANDYAFGTSSRSSKLVHGGFRYLYNRQYHVTYESVTERQRLLREAPCLITSLPFNLPNYSTYEFPSSLFSLGLGIYDLMAKKWDHRALSFSDMEKQIPGLTAAGYHKGFRYHDAILDDARLVFRIIRETMADGGTAINYAKAEHLLRDKQGIVRGMILRDMAAESNPTIELRAQAVVNASGPWSDQVRGGLQVPGKLRPLRGSHIILPFEILPVREAVTFFHPRDKRAMFVIPWEGMTMVGTTDVDYNGDGFHPDIEPSASQDEIDYILNGITFLFPNFDISQKHIISTFAGLRPVIDTGAATPSKESRAHQAWEENGLVTVSGGKLTTFRVMAADTLELVSRVTSRQIRIDPSKPMLKPVCNPEQIKAMNYVEKRILGRSGLEAENLLQLYPQTDHAPMFELPAVWAELKFAARAEAVQHLDDLLLRRTRIGMLLPDGGQASLPAIRSAVQHELRWSDSRWKKERDRYKLSIWKKAYSPHPGR